MFTLSKEECQAIYDSLDELSGGNPENVFAWDGSDDPEDPRMSAHAKIFAAADRSIPPSLVSCLEGY